MVSQGSYNGDRVTAMLNVVETNPFKHLTHLSLKFVPGTDADVKKYLADCLKQLKVCMSKSNLGNHKLYSGKSVYSNYSVHVLVKNFQNRFSRGKS